MIPGLVVAAPGSGSGKTSVTCGLAAALSRRGLDVRCFKAGPDYLDPSWHQLASGRVSRNLDGWMTGRDGVRASFARGARDGDIALVEGVMGLFDGRDPTTLEGSGAELAQWLGLPVLLVVDARGMARSAAAVVEGFARHVPGVEVAGVVFNRLGGPGHARLLAEAMVAVPGVACLGGLSRQDDVGIPERHLGLVGAGAAGAEGWTARVAAWVEGGIDLDRVLALARRASGDFPEYPDDTVATPVRIGVARDAAFHFYYEDNLDLLREAGAEIVPFSPLGDRRLPAVDGLYIGGGYPEAHARALSANTEMRAAIRDFAGPVYAECGGLMYLGEALDGQPMAGRLPVRTRMTPRLRALGYRDVVATRDCLLGPAGTRFRGHEFHYSELAEVPPLAPAYAWEGRGGRGVEGWSAGTTLGSYVHVHFGSNPSLATNLVSACAGAR